MGRLEPTNHGLCPDIRSCLGSPGTRASYQPHLPCPHQHQAWPLGTPGRRDGCLPPHPVLCKMLTWVDPRDLEGWEAGTEALLCPPSAISHQPLPETNTGAHCADQGTGPGLEAKTGLCGKAPHSSVAPVNTRVATHSFKEGNAR